MLTRVIGPKGGDVRIDLASIDAVEPITPPGEQDEGCRVLLRGVWVYLAMTPEALYALM